MTCVDAKQPTFLIFANNNAAPINLPCAIQVDTSDSADFLEVSPGLYNQGGIAANQSIGIRVYKGRLLTNQIGSVQTGYAIPNFPEFSMGGLNANILPWGKPLQLVVEVTGIGTIPANSYFEVSVNPFNLD